MPGQFLKGKRGGVIVTDSDGNNGIRYRFKRWQVELKTDILDSTNFESEGVKENEDGLQFGDLTISGTYDHGAMPLTTGVLYYWEPEMGPGISLSVPARVANIKIVTETEKLVEIEITANSSGALDLEVE